MQGKLTALAVSGDSLRFSFRVIQWIRLLSLGGRSRVLAEGEEKPWDCTTDSPTSALRWRTSSLLLSHWLELVTWPSYLQKSASGVFYILSYFLRESNCYAERLRLLALHLLFVFFLSVATSRSMWDLSSLTRDQTCASCIGGMEF